MGETTTNPPEKKPSKWSPNRILDWIDSLKSESKRRIAHTVIGGIILAIGGIIWQHVDILKRFPSWLFTILQSPIQLTIWVLLLFILFPFGLLWFAYWIYKKNKTIAELQAKVKTLTPRTDAEVLNEIFERNRLSPKLITKSVFYPKIIPTEDSHGRSAHIKIEAANDSQRPIILTELAAEYDDGDWRSIYIHKRGQKDTMAGVRLNDQEKYEVPEDEFYFMIVNTENGQGARDFWFVDSLGNKHSITDIKENLARYWANP